ncbi:MocR-like pyridoxine biosynthesis transcription factor PdxR [Streptomyces cylindrosporus]|uniref:PLP-dependent aminotransferase family protein n=1 Tax=Streptomyces cylindrosporus TaxID=2927583 RepID=A0ABS9YL53_9ACTN|nr:PLP-dependent aminotransferase family protein [Streptomyces cylindrosporus]MCI3277285.1 PLP-dependent aminotransferase family protein [Streptomyces cylindrosporus]
MAESWVNSAERIGADLHLEVAAAGGRRAAVAAALREAVRSGRLAPGTRLPPYRSLAADLGVARNTVADAYSELVAEGWLTARQGSGTRVAERAEPLRRGERGAISAQARARDESRPARARDENRPARARGSESLPPNARGRRTPPPPLPPPPPPRRPLHDLRQGTPDASAFPRGEWVASYRRAVLGAAGEVFGPGEPAGRVELREALAEYLARTRGVRTEPGRIVVCSGFAHGLRLLFGGGVLRGPLAVEAYGLPFHRELLAGAGVRTVPLPLDEHGALVGRLGRERAVLLTPAHQFPTGGPLHAERRAAVVDWARARDGVVLEDDYDGEFRYDRKPVGAVQGLDPERVILLGSVSKSLSPAVRLGWMVLPERYVDGVLAAKGEREAWASVLDQLSLADFISSGSYDRHVRRMRQRYRRRRDRLVAALAEHAPHIEVTGVAAGLHAVLRLPPGTERSAVKAAVWNGVALDGLAEFRHPDAEMDTPDGLVVGYATPPEHAYGAALEALLRVLPPGAPDTAV